MPNRPDVMDKLVSLCKRRGFIFQSSEIYGGTGSVWDYGPLGIELKRNLQERWWSEMVRSRDNVEGHPHASPGLGSQRPRERFRRPDGRLPKLQEEISCRRFENKRNSRHSRCSVSRMWNEGDTR